MHRRDLIKTSLALGGLATLDGCSTAAGSSMGPSTSAVRKAGALPPMNMSSDQIIDVKSCLRPFRPAGPRLDAEVLGDTLVIHNYGHGGSGWSLSWGSAALAVDKAMATAPKEVAVVGCGIIGLTAAITAQRAGLKVTIYTKDLLPRTRSFRANGSWTPDSRVSLTEPAGADFGALWEQMARTSWKTYRQYLGLPGRPIDFCDSYLLSDTPITSPKDEALDPAKGTYNTTGRPNQNAEFGKYTDRIKDITPGSELLKREDNPFPIAYASRSSMMFFNFSTYGALLMEQFYEAGGKIEIREFHSPGELKTLKEKVVINCPGFAARDLWKDTSLIPFRGQTAWLVPQPECHYSVFYNGAVALSKADGIMVQHIDEVLGEMADLGNSVELPNRAESEQAVQALQKVFL